MDELLLTAVKPRPIKWSQATVILLIQLWRKWDLLYDKKNNLYYNKAVRANVLELISKTLQEHIPQMTSNEVRFKMHNLRTQLALNLGKLNAAKNGGPPYQPDVYWFDEMQFLMPFVKAKNVKEISTAKATRSETMDDNTMSDPDEPLVPVIIQRRKAESSLSENDDPLFSSNKEMEFDENLASETEEPTSTDYIKAENILAENKTEKAEENNIEDVLTLGKNISLKLSLAEKPITPEEEYENAMTNFFRVNIHEVTDKDLKDELALKIMTLVFEYKKKQRQLDRSLNKIKD